MDLEYTMTRLLLVLTLVFSVARSQVVNNVRVINHADYILKVIQETVTEVEAREWCNLKLPDFTKELNELVIDRSYVGTISYTDGFVVSIQHVDVQQSTVQQVWSWNSTNATGTVSLRGTLRLTDLVIGYDTFAVTEDGSHRYTTTFRHPLISFAFSINYNTHTQEIAITVVGTVPRVTTVRPAILPLDPTSVVLSLVFDPSDTAPGIEAWGENVFQPICTGAAARVEFPRICYDCPIV